MEILRVFLHSDGACAQVARRCGVLLALEMLGRWETENHCGTCLHDNVFKIKLFEIINKHAFSDVAHQSVLSHQL